MCSFTVTCDVLFSKRHEHDAMYGALCSKIYAFELLALTFVINLLDTTVRLEGFLSWLGCPVVGMFIIAIAVTIFASESQSI